MLKHNILYFGPCDLHQGIGGGARLKNMLNVLEELDVNTHLISYLPEKKFRVTHEQIMDCLHTTTISVPGSSPKVLKMPALLLVLAYGLSHIRKRDIIFAHAPGIASGFPAFILAKMFNKPFVIDHMDIKDPDTPRFIYNRVLRNSRVVLAISRFLEKEAREIGCRNVVYLPVFIDTNTFQGNIHERVRLRETLGINDKEIVIGYAGAFVPEEGLSFLLRAFNNLSQRYKNIKLVLVGGTLGNIPELTNDAWNRERVIIIPPQPYKLMAGYLSTFDIACSPKSDSAGNRAANPIKIYEYMSMGLPTVASGVGEISTIIENGVDGFLVKPGDDNDLARTLQYIIQNLDSAKAAGERAREKMVKNYSRQVMLERIGDVLKEVSGKIIRPTSSYI